MKNRSGALAAALALFLASAAFAQQPASAPTATLSLRQAVAEAVLRNPNRVRAAHEVTAAGFERDAAEWGRFPTLSVDLPFWNWYRFPSAYTAAQFVEHLVGYMVGGLVVAAIVKPSR